MTQGEITGTEMGKKFGWPRRSGMAFAQNGREISVRYTVNGTEYNTEFKLPADAAAMPTPHPRSGLFSTGTKAECVTFYYDPENPHVVVLHPGDRTVAVFSIGTGSVMTVICSMFIFVLQSGLPRRRGTN